MRSRQRINCGLHSFSVGFSGQKCRETESFEKSNRELFDCFYQYAMSPRIQKVMHAHNNDDIAPSLHQKVALVITLSKKHCIHSKLSGALLSHIPLAYDFA
jgi:hypothetical protein